LAMVIEQKSIKKKAQAVEELNTLLNKFNTIAIADLHKVRAIQLQQLYKNLRNDVSMMVVKNSLITRALKKNRKKNIENLAESITGTNILLLTNMDPFILALILDKNKMKMPAKSGDIAPSDILIPAGNTGLPPGPAISELQNVGIRTRINVGSVWVLSDTVVVKKGEVIEMKVASVLSKLGFKPIEVGLVIRAAYDNGLIFMSEQLKPKIGEIKKQLENAVSQAFNLAVNSLYPTPLTLKLAFQQAYRNARNLAINSDYVAPEVIGEIIAKAHSHMLSLSSKISNMS